MRSGMAADILQRIQLLSRNADVIFALRPPGCLNL
jgi:hypothetical protein